jgi:putative transport protein
VIDLLADTPLLLLFVVAAVGVPLGNVPLGGSRLGVAAVLFSGLAVGALDPRLTLPPIVYLLGLVLFIYPVGLSSGPAFFAAFRRKGLRDNVLVAAILVAAAGIAGAIGAGLGLGGPRTAGLFAGALTNTPALAAVLDAVERANPGAPDRLLTAPAVGYSIAYPMGVLGVILAIVVTQRLWRVDYDAEGDALAHLGASHRDLSNLTVEVTRPEHQGRLLAALAEEEGWEVVFSRIETAEGIEVVDPETRLQFGQRITVVGTDDALEAVRATLGRAADEGLTVDRSAVDHRRIFVSSPEAVGVPLRDLHLPRRFGAVVTRVRRGDVELMPDADMVLELGDRVRVVAPRERIEPLSDWFGDSYHAVSQVNVLTFSLGIALGMLVGRIPIPVGGVTVQLGLAGGPLLVGLVLGARGATGPLVWTMPYGANHTLRQFGLVLFFAGVGTRAGYAFAETLLQPSGLLLFGAGAALTCSVALLTLWVGHRRLGIPMSLLTGMLAGLHTQPAVLTHATEQTGNDLPNVGYATVFPTATLLKLILAQLLLALPAP